MKRHPEMQLIDNLRVETLIEEASQMYAKVSYFQTKRHSQTRFGKDVAFKVNLIVLIHRQPFI